MAYKELSKIFYGDPTSERKQNVERVYRDRFNASTTFRLGFQTPVGELFIAVPRELSLLSESVLVAERAIAAGLGDLPDDASRAVLRGIVIDEVVSNNAIEDIRSTRKQVRDALEAPKTAPRSATRFRELALLYLELLEGNAPAVRSPEDVRRIYDDVTSGEIAPDKQPDGRLFRAQGVDIVQGGHKVVHHGLEPESKIVSAIEKMLEISHDAHIPSLYRTLAAHYLFEYIHPFYDGNGRTGRYLLSRSLGETLSAATALSLSRIIAENRATYYQAFRTTEKPLNKGELTFFVNTMLEIVREAQVQLADRISAASRDAKRIAEAVESLQAKTHLEEKDAAIVAYLLQRAAFGLFDDAPLGAIADHLGVGSQMARKRLARLEERGVVERVRKRNPVSFALTSSFKSQWDL